MRASPIDLLIVGLCLAAVVDGSRRGFLPYATELVALAGGVAAGLLLYPPVGGFMAATFRLSPELARFAVFLVSLVVVRSLIARLVGSAALAWLKQVETSLARRPRQVAGASTALALVLFVTALALATLRDLPASAAQRTARNSLIAAPLSALTQGLSRPVAGLVSLPSSPSLVVSQVPSDPGGEAFYRLSFPASLKLTEDTAAEQRMLAALNSARAQAGLAPLEPDPALQSVALAHSYDMYRRDYFSHNTPGGTTAFQRLASAHVSYVTAGENIAFAPDESRALSLLLQSPEHRANILNPDFLCVGIGVVKAPPGFEEMVTQDFTDC